jgi:hypothetical protein
MLLADDRPVLALTTPDLVSLRKDRPTRETGPRERSAKLWARTMPDEHSTDVLPESHSRTLELRVLDRALLSLHLLSPCNSAPYLGGTRIGMRPNPEPSGYGS